MQKTVIHIKDLTKKYYVPNSGKERYLALRDILAHPLKYIFKSNSTKLDHSNSFCALENINLKIKKGSVVGVIGRNGAGKSTLLKILSKITSPTGGTIKMKGRVASLLEVGTGFHPELTGRENIFLSGSILGMTKKEISQTFESIVDFAGVRKFIDMPVKRYSSGMQVRLGFAVAAHLSAEILLIDEVLAVGDIAFQKQCLGKINEVSDSGRTIIFVSHDLGAIQQLCDKTLVLNQGEVQYYGETKSAIENYINTVDPSNSKASTVLTKRHIKRIEIYDNTVLTNIISSGGSMTMKINFSAEHELIHPVLGFNIKDKYEVSVIGVNNRHYGEHFKSFKAKEGVFTINIPSLPLINGQYFIDLFLGDINGDFEKIQNAASFFMEINTSEVNSATMDKKINKIFIEDIQWKIQ